MDGLGGSEVSFHSIRVPKIVIRSSESITSVMIWSGKREVPYKEKKRK